METDLNASQIGVPELRFPRRLPRRHAKVAREDAEKCFAI